MTTTSRVDPAVPDGTAPELPPREASIVACPDGPLLVRGDVEVLDAEGHALEKGRRTVALCRCGGSSIKPWCDGTHKVNGFSSST